MARVEDIDIISINCIYTKNSIDQKGIQPNWLPTNQVIYYKCYFGSSYLFVVIVVVLQNIIYFSKTFIKFKIIWDGRKV